MTTELNQTNRTISTIDNRLTNGETRGEQQIRAIGHLEESQLLTTQILTGHMAEARQEAKAEAAVTMDKMDKAMDEARKEAKADREKAAPEAQEMKNESKPTKRHRLQWRKNK